MTVIDFASKNKPEITPAFTATGLSCVRGDRELFTELSFALSDGQILHIQGANGSGKTSLLQILCGLTLPDSGAVYWQGQALQHNYQHYLTQMHYLGHHSGIKAELSPLENLRFITALTPTSDPDRSLDVLRQVGLFGFEHEPAYSLSAGQRRRIALAGLLLSNAEVWILDEPFTALDSGGIALLEGLFEQHLINNGVIIFASHTELMHLTLPLQQIHLLQ